jgi:galactose mutarotase-like enzyme
MTMNQLIRRWVPQIILILFATLALTTTDLAAQTSRSRAPQTTSIGGEPVVILKRPRSSDRGKPQFLELIQMPGRGMAWLQVKAYVPGKGEIDLLYAPPLAQAQRLLDKEDDEFGDGVFKIGGAILLPYANRIRGKLSPDGKTLTAMVAGRSVVLPANWSSGKPGAEKHAIHGLMLKSKFQDVKEKHTDNASSVSAVLHAGDFAGHWFSQTDVTVEIRLADDSVEMSVTAKNVGQQTLPMGIGWHPYFVLPSGDRKQVRLRIPSGTRAVMNNYDDSFPTGQRVAVRGTPYDFDAPEGRALGDQYLDDSYSALERRPDGSTISEIIDPAAKYGLRLITESSDIRAIQVYAPPTKNFVAIEPQFNFPDPYNRGWGSVNTGMVLLEPGQWTEWSVRLELFTPNANGH